MSVEQNKALARQAISIWSTGDVDAADEVYGRDFVTTSTTTPMIPATSAASRR